MADEGKRLSQHYHRILATAPDAELQTVFTARTTFQEGHMRRLAIPADLDRVFDIHMHEAACKRACEEAHFDQLIYRLLLNEQ